MRQMQGVLWTKGVLLNPQHLQVQDRYLEDKLGFHLATITSCGWGFCDLEIDAEGLAGGEFRLHRAAGLFPDGLAFEIPDADPPPPPRPLDVHWKPDQTSMLVFLAIPDYRHGGRNVSATLEDTSVRFSPEVLSRRDENTGSSEKEILVARKNFRLLVEGEALEGSSVLALARLIRTPSGEVELDPDFVPPLLDIAASERVLSIARRLVEILAAKSTELGGKRRERAGSLAEFGRADVAHFWLLYTVNSNLPLFRHLYGERGDSRQSMERSRSAVRSHPVKLYQAMSELAGALMTFSPNHHPRDIPTYDHLHLSECFTELDEMLRGLLETAVPSSCVTLPLRLGEQSIYSTSIDEDEYMGAVQAYLAVSAEIDQAQLIERAPSWIKVGSRDQIGDLLSRAVPGVPLRHVASPPSAVSVKLGRQYFRMEMRGPLWASIQQSRSLAAWVPADLADAELELVLLLPTKES